jgi:hypothetical protein
MAVNVSPVTQNIDWKYQEFGHNVQQQQPLPFLNNKENDLLFFQQQHSLHESATDQLKVVKKKPVILNNVKLELIPSSQLEQTVQQMMDQQLTGQLLEQLMSQQQQPQLNLQQLKNQQQPQQLTDHKLHKLKAQLQLLKGQQLAVEMQQPMGQQQQQLTGQQQQAQLSTTWLEHSTSAALLADLRDLTTKYTAGTENVVNATKAADTEDVSSAEDADGTEDATGAEDAASAEDAAGTEDAANAEEGAASAEYASSAEDAGSAEDAANAEAAASAEYAASAEDAGSAEAAASAEDAGSAEVASNAEDAASAENATGTEQLSSTEDTRTPLPEFVWTEIDYNSTSTATTTKVLFYHNWPDFLELRMIYIGCLLYCLGALVPPGLGLYTVLFRSPALCLYWILDCAV